MITQYVQGIMPGPGDIKPIPPSEIYKEHNKVPRNKNSNAV